MSKLRRFVSENQCYHVATSTWQRAPIFKDRASGAVVVSALQFLREERAYVLAYALMPDHLHAVLVPKDGHNVSGLMQTVKGYSARLINHRLGLRGPLWQRSFYDRMMRDEQQLLETIRYVHENPVVAGLVKEAEDYEFSSAGRPDLVDLETYLG